MKATPLFFDENFKRTLAPNFDCHHWRQLVSVFLKVPHNLSFFVTISAPFQNELARSSPQLKGQEPFDLDFTQNIRRF